MAASAGPGLALPLRMPHWKTFVPLGLCFPECMKAFDGPSVCQKLDVSDVASEMQFFGLQDLCFQRLAEIFDACATSKEWASDRAMHIPLDVSEMLAANRAAHPPGHTDEGWFFLDLALEEFGPFPSALMMRWFSDGCFPQALELPLRMPHWKTFMPLGLCFPDSTKAFVGPSAFLEPMPCASSAAASTAIRCRSKEPCASDAASTTAIRPAG